MKKLFSILLFAAVLSVYGCDGCNDKDDTTTTTTTTTDSNTLKVSPAVPDSLVIDTPPKGEQKPPPH